MMSAAAEKIQDDLKNFYDDTFTDENISKIKEIHQASKWIKITKNRDEFMSNLANKMVSTLFEKSSIPFVNLVIDKIRINTSNNEPGIKFNLSFNTDPLKPYIKFVKCENEIPTETIFKTIFQIDSCGVITDAQIELRENARVLKTGKLNLHVKFSIIDFDFAPLSSKKQIVLYEKDFPVDLTSKELIL